MCTYKPNTCAPTPTRGSNTRYFVLNWEQCEKLVMHKQIYDFQKKIVLHFRSFKLIFSLYTNSIPLSQTKQSFSHSCPPNKNKQLPINSAITADCCDNHKERIKTMWGKQHTVEIGYSVMKGTECFV